MTVNKYLFSNDKGELLPRRSVAGLMGTIMYAPITAHSFYDQSRKDDLESWLYMLIEMLTGTLPWIKLNPVVEHLSIGEWKKFCRTSGRNILFANCPTEFNEMLYIIDKAGYCIRPDYHFIQCFINAAMERYNVARNTPYEWEVDERILRKAEVIGARGESEMASERLKNWEEFKERCSECDVNLEA
ncbi:hypothetical protein AB6A40_008734 [Gnathostoma spinigerum]|uniref:Protein kinase domain-containing protein n=1 Tax=Gnathostoma spinigerum TaxID=75299 RepID=A0ABD6EPX6_9BILA